jgi:hypothetical protein
MAEAWFSQTNQAENLAPDFHVLKSRFFCLSYLFGNNGLRTCSLQVRFCSSAVYLQLLRSPADIGFYSLAGRFAASF